MYIEDFLKLQIVHLSEFTWKRCAFRTLAISVLLFIGETIPSFGSILDLIGGSTVTCKYHFLKIFIEKNHFIEFFIRFDICFATIVLHVVNGLL